MSQIKKCSNVSEDHSNVQKIVGIARVNKERTGASPDQIAQLVTASSQYAKIAGSIPSQGTYMQEPTNECINKCLSLKNKTKEGRGDPLKGPHMEGMFCRSPC